MSVDESTRQTVEEALQRYASLMIRDAAEPLAENRPSRERIAEAASAVVEAVRADARRDLETVLREITDEYDHTYSCAERPGLPCDCVFGRARAAVGETSSGEGIGR